MESKRSAPGLSRRAFLASSTMGLAAGSLSSNAWSFGKPAAGRPAPSAASGKSRVIIDTDPGTDDAFALLLAMRSPELKIEAITPVAGNVPLHFTLPNALRMVEVAGRTDIPVAGGAKTPLIRRLVTAEYAHGENGLGGAVFPEPKTKPAAMEADEMIRRVVNKYPGEVTLITLGPLTNVARALLSDAGLAGKIKGIVMMGGSLSGGNITPAAEFNFYVDPEAARLVFQSGVPLRMVGLDVTRKTELTWDHVRILESSSDPVSQAAAKIARNTMKMDEDEGYVVGAQMHDSLALSSFIDRSLLRLEKYYVDVETYGELTAGETVGYSPDSGDLRRLAGWKKTHPQALQMSIRGSAPSLARTTTSPVLRDQWVPNADVAVDVDAPRFFRLLIGRLSGKEMPG